MRLIYATLLILLIPSTSFAGEGCWDALKAHAQKINEEEGGHDQVAAQVYSLNGQIGYWPGITVDSGIENWAQDFSRAITDGPKVITFGNQEDRQKQILEMFHEEISEDCILPEGNHAPLRAMLKELMDEGAFCPQGEMLKRPMLGRWKNYKRVALDAVKGGRFQELCQSVAIDDQSIGEGKDITPVEFLDEGEATAQ
jgi:hypothetical protein